MLILDLFSFCFIGYCSDNSVRLKSNITVNVTHYGEILIS